MLPGALPVDTHVSQLLLQQPVLLLELLHGSLDRGVPACVFRLHRDAERSVTGRAVTCGRGEGADPEAEVSAQGGPHLPRPTPEGRRLSPCPQSTLRKGHGAAGQAWPWPRLIPSSPPLRGLQTLGQFHAGSGSHPELHSRAALWGRPGGRSPQEPGWDSTAQRGLADRFWRIPREPQEVLPALGKPHDSAQPEPRAGK